MNLDLDALTQSATTFVVALPPDVLRSIYRLAAERHLSQSEFIAHLVREFGYFVKGKS